MQFISSVFNLCILSTVNGQNTELADIEQIHFDFNMTAVSKQQLH